MLSFALKNMAIKKIQVILIVISIVISAGVAVLAYNTSNQVRDGITDTAGWYSAIIGPSGSKTQLAMNTMYFTDEPLGTVPYSVVGALQRDSRVKKVIPYAMADNYNGYRVVGTASAYLESKEILEGRMFDDSGVYEVVLGASVAKVCDVRVGDEIFTSHSASEEHTEPLKVVGILKESHSVFDRTVFTQLKTIWEVHEHGEHGEEEEHEHGEMNGGICAAIVTTQNPAYAMALVNEYDGKIITDDDGDQVTLQAIEPMETVRSILEEADSTKYIVYVLCAIILVMNVMVISIITLLNMYNSAKEISLMRLIGISMKKINLLYILQNGLIGIVSVALAFAVSKICLLFMDSYASSMGVVLDTARIYPAEWVILALVFAIAVLPTVVCTFVMARRDSINE
jgi:ABC-type lipoprotein release transport system permease subunit